MHSPIKLQLYGMSVKVSLSTYGVLTGMALPCILFPSAITNSVSTMLLPTVAEIQAMDERSQLSSLIRKVFFSCITLGCICCAGLLLFAWLHMLCRALAFRTVDRRVSFPQSVSRRFYCHTGMDVSFFIHEQYVTQHSKWNWQDKSFLFH